jgi:hypothetical protein
VKERIIKEKINYSSSGDEYIIYEFNNTMDTLKLDLLSTSERKIMSRVLNELCGLGPKALTQIAYETTPMKKIGARSNNRIGLNKELNLSA